MDELELVNAESDRPWETFVMSLLDDEGPFVSRDEAMRRQEWLEVTYDMGYRVFEHKGSYYVAPSTTLPIEVT